jgi:hypothetical protein
MTHKLSTWLSRVGLGALALVVGFSVAAVPRLVERGSDAESASAPRRHPRSASTERAASQATTRTLPLAATTTSEPADSPAATPTDAVDAFLRAEQQGEFATSYGLLVATDRMTHRSRAGWTAAHAQLPVVRGYTLGTVRAGQGRALVDSTVELRPELDPVVGLVPGTVVATWVVLAEDGGWRVDFAESTLMPQYPPADVAPAAARAWVAERAGCGDKARAALLGTGTLADELCDARGRPQVGAPVALEPSESSDSLLAAFGPDVFTWARVVPVSAPARVGAVLAPVGARWRVIGLVEFPSPQPTFP